ncbi:unnamed protein product [Blepharisma stoltei]|uniref:Uncharacterized protein n=1 Tax=Blepharisma stoltei TaxID=1481888 RepID=A0AAU9JV32_9CILI|nr:unnamed protein product [Blepharisma stoltei]
MGSCINTTRRNTCIIEIHTEKTLSDYEKLKIKEVTRFWNSKAEKAPLLKIGENSLLLKRKQRIQERPQTQSSSTEICSPLNYGQSTPGRLSQILY